MPQAIKATIDEKGNVQLLEAVHLSKKHKAIVTILDDETESRETVLLSEKALAKDWNRPEEDEAWSHLQKDPSSSFPSRIRI